MCVCVCVSVCVSVSFIATAIEQHMECLQLSVMRHRIQYTQSHSSTRTHTHVFGGLQVVSPSCVSFIATAIEQHMEDLLQRASKAARQRTDPARYVEGAVCKYG